MHNIKDRDNKSNAITIEEKINYYQYYETEYKNKVSEFLNAYASINEDPDKLSAWPVQGRKHHADIFKAKRDWEEFGFKQEIDEVLSEVNLELNLDGGQS